MTYPGLTKQTFIHAGFTVVSCLYNDDVSGRWKQAQFLQGQRKQFSIGRANNNDHETTHIHNNNQAINQAMNLY